MNPRSLQPQAMEERLRNSTRFINGIRLFSCNAPISQHSFVVRPAVACSGCIVLAEAKTPSTVFVLPTSRTSSMKKTFVASVGLNADC